MTAVKNLLNPGLPPPWDNQYQSGGSGGPPRKPDGSEKQGSDHGVDVPDVAPSRHCNTCGKECNKFRCACDCDHYDDHGHVRRHCPNRPPMTSDATMYGFTSTDLRQDNDLQELEEAQAHLNKITADLECTKAALDSARNWIVQIARRLGAAPPPGLVQPRAPSVANSIASSNTLGRDTDDSCSSASASTAAASDYSSEWSISDHPAILAHLDAVPFTPRSQTYLGSRPNTSPQASWPATPEAPEESRWVPRPGPGITLGNVDSLHEVQIANHASTTTAALPQQPQPPPPPAYPHAAHQPARPASPSPDNGWPSPVAYTAAAHAPAPAPADPAVDLASAWAPVASPPPYWASFANPASGLVPVDAYGIPIVDASASAPVPATAPTAAAYGAGAGVLWIWDGPADSGLHLVASLASSGAGGQLPPPPPPPPPYRPVDNGDFVSYDYDYDYEYEARQQSGWEPRRAHL
ncbi:hypothetical protein UCDDS831_g02814 [Diplodia seriata]|uniref:Uncharacterized protein n=1 Tax=Diplodia seriata TaxID=420778 RepID=A0A0G2GJU6_9PEZI|nr:hypothetical protein UCDDS831_g02814 [Diplodia seriata]